MISTLSTATVITLVITVSLSSSTTVLRPRGVSLQKSALYNPAKPFVCFDGSGQIPFESINDDYCDCMDGSDEPGTSACVNGTFYCNNIGHAPKVLASSFVNDGVCDCCDASDEWGSKAECINNCDELGQVAKKEAELRVQEEMKGYNIRQQMAEQGQQIKKDKQSKLSELESVKEEAEAMRQEKLAVKELAEAPENEALEKYKEIEEQLKQKREEEKKFREDMTATDAFADLDGNADGAVTLAEIQSKIIFDTNKDGDVSEDEAKFYLGQADSVSLETFLATAWPLLKPTYQYGKSMFVPPEPTESPEELVETIADLPHEEVGEASVVEESFGGEFDEHLQEEEDEEDVDDEDYADEIDDDQITKEKEIAELEDEIQYDEETQLLVNAANAARSEYDEQDKNVKDILNEIQALQKTLEKDYGPNDEYRPLLESCFEFTEREYTYKICPFDYASQKQRNGNSETRLGSWGHWSGPQGFPYTAMKYSGGQQCWNGPQRSAEVQLHCATETALTAVSEPNRCEYLFQLSTPAVCRQPVKDDSLHQHIEL